MTVDVAIPGADALGECPLWNDREGALYWVDGRAPALYRWTPDGGRRAWTLPEIVGSFAFRAAGGVLVALQTGVYMMDLDTGAIDLLVNPEPDQPDNRFNDGRVDRRGRFWVGTMNALTRVPTGHLYRVMDDGSCHRLFGDIIVPNSLAWAPDDEYMYFADTYQKRIWRFEFDADSGTIANRELFADLAARPGRPDGSAVDADGGLWNCEYAGGRVVRYAPDGRIDTIVTVPVDNPTCCAFGGSDFRTLYITSARQRLTPEELARQPLAGSVFAVRTVVSGLPESRFGH